MTPRCPGGCTRLSCRSAQQPAPNSCHSLRCRGAAFNPGQAAKRPGCAQPSPAPQPAGGQARGPGTRCRRRPVRSRQGDGCPGLRRRRSRSPGRGQGERAPSTPRPLSRVLLTPGCPGPAIPVTSAPAATWVPEPTLLAAPPPGPGQPAQLGAAAGTPRPLSAQLCSPRSVLGPDPPCRGRPARYLQGARAAAASPSRARKLPRLWSPARSWAGGGAARAAPPAPRRAPSRAARSPHLPQLPKLAGGHCHTPASARPLLAAIGCFCRHFPLQPVPLQPIG